MLYDTMMEEELYMQNYDEICDKHVNEITNILSKMGCSTDFCYFLDTGKIINIVPRFGYSTCYKCGEIRLWDDDSECCS
jgi:hypothetical protein